MSKESGIGLSVNVDDSAGAPQNISNDILNCNWNMPSAEQDVTGLDKSAHERLLLLADFSVSLSGAFDDGANLSFAVFKNYRTLLAGQVGRTTTIAHSGQTLPVEVLYTDFSHARAADGSLIWTAPGSLSSGTVPTWA